MKCVVTGAAGFIGSSLTDRLLTEGHTVIGIDCFVDYYPRKLKEQNLHSARDNSRFKFVEMDLLDPRLASQVEGAEVIFHQAAQAGVRASWGDNFSTYTNNNILGTQRLLELCRATPLKSSLKRVVYASSSSVYGHAETLPTTEDVLPAPISPYGVTKLAAEHLMVLYAKEFGVPTVSLRYFTVYGPRQRPDMAFHRFIRAALQGEAITLYGDGEQSRDFTFIGDIVQANIDAALYGITVGSNTHQSVDGAVFNLGGGSRVTVNQVIAMLESILGRSIAVQRLAREAGDARHTGADTAKARRILGFDPKVSLKEGLSAEASWMESLLAK